MGVLRSYYSQETLHTCGPAVLRIQSAHSGLYLPEEHIADVCETNPDTGTNHTSMVRAAQNLGFRAEYGLGRLSDLRVLTRSGVLPIIDYCEPDGDLHYALVQRVSRGRVHLADPYHGPEFSMSIEELEKRWRVLNRRSRTRGWMMVLLPDQEVFVPEAVS